MWYYHGSDEASYMCVMDIWCNMVYNVHVMCMFANMSCMVYNMKASKCHFVKWSLKNVKAVKDVQELIS